MDVIPLQFSKALPHTTDIVIACHYAWRGSDLSLPLAATPGNHRRTILHYHKAYNQPGIDPPLPPINHDGINDGIMEKASTIYYYHRGKWLGLHGAD
jgi:hypothetical protein